LKEWNLGFLKGERRRCEADFYFSTKYAIFALRLYRGVGSLSILMIIMQ